LHKLGFHLTLINEDSFWYFTEEILEANFKTYRLQFNIVRGFPNIIEFKAFVKRMEIDNKKFSYLLADFEKENIFFDFDAIKKVYKLKKVNDMTSAQLENELDFFIKKLKENGFEAN
jgi:hypothetical protein